MKSFYDVAIIGGGPAGSTTASLLRKYAPQLSVAVIEREQFPRDHVGESQLPVIADVLNEMGCWDKVEAAGFPIKIGATYRWGNSDDLWDFELFPKDQFVDEARPAKYVGQRVRTAFQVDRAKYDKILLDHAESIGAEVFQATRVRTIGTDGSRCTHLEVGDGHRLEAKYYIDATGSAGLLRRTLNVPVEEPASLRNIAIWDYWTDAQWAVSIGRGGTRVFVMSLGYGWIWFIPISETRTSIGLVIPADYYLKSGKRPQELYDMALAEEPFIRGLIADASCEGRLSTTKDWSFVATQMTGPNWFLVGESAGFADPILAAGMSIAQVAARDCACTITELERGELDADWLREQYTRNQSTRLHQHIRFANFWYSANGIFTDLKDYTRDIARDAGLELNANEAFQWLGTGGFVQEGSIAGLAGFGLDSVKDTVELFLQQEAELECVKYNFFRMNLKDTEVESYATYGSGRVTRKERLGRDGKFLPGHGFFHVLRQIIDHNGMVDQILAHGVTALMQKGMARTPDEAVQTTVSHLEALLRDGWVKGKFLPSGPTLDFAFPKMAAGIKFTTDVEYPAVATP